MAALNGPMLQGKDAIPFLETLIVGDIASLEDRTGTLSVFTNEKGGIIDDSVITKARTCNIRPVHSHVSWQGHAKTIDMAQPGISI